jgi:transposase-like protein
MSNKRYPQELRDRAVRLVLETRDQYPSLNQAIHSIGAKLGAGPESLRNWVRQAEVDAGASESAAADVISTATGMAGALWQMAAPRHRTAHALRKSARAGARGSRRRTATHLHLTALLTGMRAITDSATPRRPNHTVQQ